MAQSINDQLSLLGNKLAEFGMSPGQTAGAQKGCSSSVGCVGFLFLAGSVIGIVQGSEWPLVLLNLGIFVVVVLIFLGLLRFFKWSRQRIADARLQFYERGFIQNRPSGFRRMRPETCLWSEVREVQRGKVISNEVLWLKIVKTNGDVIRIPNQWLEFPVIVGIIDTRGAVLDPGIAHEEAARLMDNVNMKGVSYPVESE